MARPSTKPRVPELDPDAEALAFTTAIYDHYRAGVHEHLGPTCELLVPSKRKHEDYLRETNLYMRTRQIAAYAIRGEPLKRTLRDLLATLEPFASGPLWDRADLASVVANVDPNHEESAIKLLLAAAVAREQIEHDKHDKQPITSAQLAILSGMSRRHIGQLIREGELKIVQEGRVGTGGGAQIKTSVASEWLAKRGVAGFARRTPKH